MPDMLRKPPSEKNERTMVDVVVGPRAGAGPEIAGVASPGMRVQLVVGHEVRVLRRIPLAFALGLPAELERGAMPREIHVVDAVVAKLAEEGARVEFVARQQRDRRRAPASTPNLRPRPRAPRRSCRAHGRDRRRSRWCERGIRPGCGRLRRPAAACGSGIRRAASRTSASGNRMAGRPRWPPAASRRPAGPTPTRRRTW